MVIVPQIVFDGLDPSNHIQARIEQEVDKLQRFSPHIMSCRVIVRRPQKRHSHGDLYDVAIHLTLSGGREVVSSRNPKNDHSHEDVYVSIRDAFAAARRQLQDNVRRIRGVTKHHSPLPEALVGTLIALEEYGFLETVDGREIYFHKNSVVDDGFFNLKVGDRVYYSEAQGDKGPQATMVKLV